MSGHDRYSTVVALAMLAFLVRLLATPLAAFRINPYSRRDPVQFAETASIIATRFVETGAYLPPDVSYTETIWPTLLAPLWLLPGPSSQYARILISFFGALIVVNVYVIARQYHSRQAGILAALPLAFYPTHIMLHSTLMRDVVIIFGMTTAARLWVPPPTNLNRRLQSALAGAVLVLATVLRPDNAPLYLLVFAIGIMIIIHESEALDIVFPVGSPTRMLCFGGITALLAYPIVQRVLPYLAGIRQHRAKGDALYLTGLNLITPVSALSGGWILVMYFLYAPFPWMVASPAELAVALEGVITMLLTVAGLYGARYAVRNHSETAIPLLVGLVVGCALYALGTVNYGAASRFRQSFTWLIFLFGGIGLATRIRFRFGR